MTAHSIDWPEAVRTGNGQRHGLFYKLRDDGMVPLICPTRLGKNSDYGAGVARSVTPASHSAMLGWNVCKTSGIERRAEARPLSRATRAFSAMYATKRSKPRMLSMRVKL